MFINVFTNQREQKIYESLEDSIKSLGYRIVKVTIKKNGKRDVVQIMIDRLDKKPTDIMDCKKVSNNLFTQIDAEGVIDKNSNLEISSPGLDRPLTTIEDLHQNIGSSVNIKLWRKLEGCNNIKGILQNTGEGYITITTNIIKKQDSQAASLIVDSAGIIGEGAIIVGNNINIPFDNLRSICLEYDVEKLLNYHKKKR